MNIVRADKFSNSVLTLTPMSSSKQRSEEQRWLEKDMKVLPA